MFLFEKERIEMKKYFIGIFFITQIFALGGIGVYGNSDSFSSTPAETNVDNIFVTPQTFDGAQGGGLFVYLDVLPIVDIEANIELVGNLYKFTTSTQVGGVLVPLSPQPGEFPWGRVSGYLTLRKKIIGLSIPFLAKAQIYGGLGFNHHTVTPSVSVDFIRGAFSNMDLDNAAEQDFGQQEIMDTLVDYMAENAITTSGFHVQGGAQFKLLMLNMFVNARYTIADNVIEGQAGFPSIWAGLALGI